MAGRHRKPNTSTPAVTAAKIAVTGAVLGGSSLALTNHASAANNWDQIAQCQLGGNSQFKLTTGPNCGRPPQRATPLAPQPPTDAPLSAPAPAAEVAAPPAEQAAVVDSVPEAPQPMDAPMALPEPAELAVAPASDNQPAPAPQLDPPTDVADAPAPQLDPPTDIADAPATEPVDDTAKQTELVTLVRKFSGTPYVWGGDSPAGTDCSGLASWLANLATGRPVFGDRFDTSNEESALLARGFQYGTAPGALVIGWNNHHTAVTLADGTPVSSGEGGGIRIGGNGAYEAQFTHHMFLPVGPEGAEVDPAPVDAPAVIEMMSSQVPAPEPSAQPVDTGGDAAI